MLDNYFSIFLHNIIKIIINAVKVWEEFSFKNMIFWEIILYNFEGFMEENFKLVSIYYQYKF